MSNVWVVMPSARPVEEVTRIVQLWHDRGYMVGLWRDLVPCDWTRADYIHVGAYRGYADAINYLVANALKTDARWIVCAADDIEPDPNHTADEIASECEGHFRGAPKAELLADRRGEWSTFGVMQPTGDRWGADDQWAKHNFPDAPAYIDRICGSAWIGREFIERTYGGKGPFWPEYKHMYCDEELQGVAKKLGVLWQRPDLTQYHRHWIREKPSATVADCPEFLKSVNSPEAWREAKALFDQRKTRGFPGAI